LFQTRLESFDVILSAMLAATIMLAEASTPATPSDLTAAPPAPASAKAVAADAKAPAKDAGRLICHTDTATGSLMAKKTCYRADDMAERKQQERSNLEHMQNNQPLTASGK
jgi:hypothetical protein